MSNSNKNVVLEFYEEVINNKKVDKFNNYFSEDYVFHASPYVGLGMNTDDSEPGKVKVQMLADGGPAAEKLKIGDEIVGIADGERQTDSIEEISQGLFWGQGKLGTTLTMTVIRDGEKIEVELMRDKIEGLDISMAQMGEVWKNSIANDILDRKTEVLFIVEDDDIVMVHDRNSGTIADYDRAAIWDRSFVYKLKDGKIVEAWGVGPGVQYFTQLGFKIEPPEKKK
jgi:predicted SnoaL-like aldol condensation-catalyzing enzyme